MKTKTEIYKPERRLKEQVEHIKNERVKKINQELERDIATIEKELKLMELIEKLIAENEYLKMQLLQEKPNLH
ncbi:MAG: hypothetical protein V2I33_16475 [Kangiellaceae bacterium]|jgi:hypothetical protein|nr:hypothetical protein [Kangiellaceae bacterium]